MEVRIHKNKSKKPFFRIKLKDNGVDYSLGIPGVTITKTGKSPNSVNNTIKPSKKSVSPLRNLFNQFHPAEYHFFLRQITFLLTLNLIGTLLSLLLLFIPLPILIQYVYRTKLHFTIVLLASFGTIGILLKLYTHAIGRIRIDFNNEAKAQEKHSQHIVAWLEMKQSQRLWYQVNNSRYNLKVTRKIPYYIKSAHELLQIQFYNTTLLFLSDMLLLVSKTKVGAVRYSDISYKVNPMAITETAQVPYDTEIIDYTWTYTTKNNTPDKRYKDNPKLPICKYGSVEMNLNNIITLNFFCSNSKNIDMLKKVDPFQP